MHLKIFVLSLNFNYQGVTTFFILFYRTTISKSPITLDDDKLKTKVIISEMKCSNQLVCELPPDDIVTIILFCIALYNYNL